MYVQRHCCIEYIQRNIFIKCRKLEIDRIHSVDLKIRKKCDDFIVYRNTL